MSVPLVVHIATFGYRYQPPPAANVVYDVRWMPDPHTTAELHDLSGLDQPVQEWLFTQHGVKDWFDALMEVLDPQLTAAERDSRSLTWAFGCAGGHFRSVAIAERVAAKVSPAGMTVSIGHLDLNRWGRQRQGSPGESAQP